VNFSDTAGTTITVNSPTEVGTTASGLNLTKANGITVAGPTVTKAGLGSLRITTAQTLTNNWVVTGGYLEAAASTALGTGQVTVSSGWLSLTNAQIANAVTLNGGGLGVRSGSVALPTENYNGAITVAGDSFITVRRSSTPTQHNGFFIGGVLSGSGALTFVPPNELTVGAGVPPNVTTVAPAGVSNLTAATSTTQGVTQGAVTLLNTGNTYSGNWNIISQQILSALPAGGTGNVFGTSHLTLKGGAVRVLDNGTADNGTLAYNNNVTIDVPSDIVNPGVATILVDRQTFPTGAAVASNPSVQGAFTGNTVQFGTLATAGGLTVKTLGLNGYGLAFSGATTISGTTNATFDTESAPLTLAGGVSGTGGLTKLGAGTLTINGTASYAGNTDVSAGILNVSGVSGGGLAIASSQTLSGSGTIAGNIKANNGATIAPGNATGVGILTVGGLTLGATGSDIANLNFTWNGGTLGSIVVSDPSALVVNGGANTAKLNFSGVSGAVGTHVLIDYNGTALTGGQFSAFKIENLFPRILGNLVNNTIDTQVELNVTGINFPRWSGTQSQEWSTNSIAGSKNWTLTTGGTQTDFITSDKVLFDNLAASKTVDISVADVTPTEVEVSNSGAGNDYTIGGAFGIIGNAPFVKNGSGKLTISNSNGFTGPVTINDGTLSVPTVTDSTVAGPLGAGNAINIVGGALEFTGLTGSTNRAIVSTAGTVKVDAGNTLTLAGAISGAHFDKSGAGTVILTGANTSTAISVSQGTLQVGDGTSAGSLGTGIITNNATLAFDPPAAGLAITNEIGGSGSINKTGANNLTLGGTTANTFTGLTTVSAGTLTAGKTAGINAIGGNLTIEGTGLFVYNGNNVGNQIADTATITVNGGTFGQITAVGTNPTNPGAPETVANVIVNSGTFSTGRAAFTATGQVAVHGGEVQSHRGALLTAHSLLIDGTGSVALDGGSATANNEPRLAVGAGGLTLDSGTINFNKQLGAAAADGSVGTRLVLQGDLTSTGVSSLVQNNTTFASVKAQVDLSGADRTFNVDGVLNIGAVGAGVNIINAGATAAGLIKTGTGNLFLAGANTYNGDTVIQDGTITITGSVSGSANIDVKTGATLDVSTASGGFVVAAAQAIKGNGLVIGATTLAGTLAPGSSIGQLDFTNDVTFTNAIAAFEIQKAGLSLTNDKAVIGGALTLAGTLNVTSLGGTFAEHDTFDLFDAASFTGTLSMGTMPALDLGLSWDVSNIGVDGSITVIPEPGSVALLVLGSTLLFRRRRNA
jgi:autotransporter-associated beta strand protein